MQSKSETEKKTKNMKNIIRTDSAVITNATDALTALTNEIRRYSVFDNDAEVEAFTALANASTDAEKDSIRRRIAEANLRFALSIAKKYSTDGDKVAELVSVATIGLYKAIDSFDLSRGFKFISHAIHWIRAEFSEHFRGDANFVRRSNNAKIGSKDNEIRRRFLQTEMREPTEDEVIEALEREYNIKVNDKLDVVRIHTASLDSTIGTDDGDSATLSEVGDIAIATASRNGYEAEMDKEDNESKVSALLKGLSIREQEIVCRKFGIGFDREYELDEIADELGYTHERVRQLLGQALNKLKGRAKMLQRLMVM